MANITIVRNSFGDQVVYHKDTYLGMAMKEVDGVWCAVTAMNPSSQMPCFDEKHALEMVLMMILADLETTQ